MHDYCNTIFSCMFSQNWCKIPEDGNYAETCRRKSIRKDKQNRCYTVFVFVGTGTVWD